VRAAEVPEAVGQKEAASQKTEGQKTEDQRIAASGQFEAAQ
jgi:hypothetical protein